MRGTALALILCATALAGCAGGEDADEVGLATATTGGLRGVVVDQSVTPVEGASVRLLDGEETTTDASGAFHFGGLEPGEHYFRVAKPGHAEVQGMGTVEAGVERPVKVVLERLVGKEPYVQRYKFEGFFECHFGAPFIVDNCDMAVRTAADALNETVGNPGVPRGVQHNENTVYYEVADNVEAIVQEAFWDNPEVGSMMILLSSTPIDNLCDCSERDHLRSEGPSPTHGRLEGKGVPRGETVAARGFLPFGDPQVAVNHGYDIVTTMFHNHVPAEDWNFQEHGS